MRTRSVQAFATDCLLPYRAFVTPILILVLLGSLAVPAGLAAATQQDIATPAKFEQVVADAAAARDKNDIPRAIQLYNQAEQLKPEWPGGWWFLGLLQYSTKAWTAASEAFTHYIDLTPPGGATIAQAIALRGLCEFETEDYPQSLADLEQGIKLAATTDPGNERMLSYREAQILTHLGRFEEALGIYGELAKAAGTGEASETSAEWNVGAGLAGLRAPLLPGDVPPSQRELYSVAGDAVLRFLAGDQAGDQEGAQQAFAILFQRFPNTPNAHYLYGFLMLPIDPDTTVAEYKRELDVSPANVTASAMLAWVLLSQDDAAQALPYAKKAVDEAPALPVAQLVLGRALAETGDQAGGIEHLERALQLQPGYLETHVALATAYAGAGRPRDAWRERLQSLQMAKVSVAK